MLKVKKLTIEKRKIENGKAVLTKRDTHSFHVNLC